MYTALIALVVFILLWNSREVLFAAFVDWIEPFDKEGTAFIVSREMRRDYEIASKLIASCDSPKLFEAAHQLITLFQQKNSGNAGEQLARELFSLFDEKKASTYGPTSENVFRGDVPVAPDRPGLFKRNSF